MSKLCPRDDADGSIINSFYLCRQNEICCSDGCCRLMNTNKYFQSWYFWLTVSVIFVIFYWCSWYCKNFENIRKRRLQRNHSRNQSLQGSPRRNEVAVNDEVENYFSNTNNIRASKVKDNCLEPPPKYQEAVNLPKQMFNTQIAQIHKRDDKDSLVINVGTLEDNMVLPSYEDATVKSAGENHKSTKK